MRFCINTNILEYFTQLKYSKAASIKVYIKEVKVKFLIKIFVALAEKAIPRGSK